MNERRAFIEAWLKKRFSFSELCERFGVSRRTGYKWVERFREQGREGLRDRSRAAHSHPNQTPHGVIRCLIELKQRYPEWGPVTLVDLLRREYPDVSWPAPSTAGAILKRHGLVEPRRRARRKTPAHSEALRSIEDVHDVWSADFKGEFVLGDGRRCYPLTITDNHSRFLIECKGLYSPRLAPVKARFERALRRYGMPKAIRTDNGYPFASTGLGGLTALSVWLLKLGITPERIAPGHPEQNPRHERMHRTLKRATATPPRANLSAQQRAFNRFRETYNHIRPHQGLSEHQRPGELFTTSTQPFPPHIAPIEYPDSFLVRRVRSKGDVKFAGHRVFLTEQLIGEVVGFEPLDDDLFRCCFMSLSLGVLDARRGVIIRPDKRLKSGR